MLTVGEEMIKEYTNYFEYVTHKPIIHLLNSESPESSQYFVVDATTHTSDDVKFYDVAVMNDPDSKFKPAGEKYDSTRMFMFAVSSQSHIYRFSATKEHPSAKGGYKMQLLSYYELNWDHTRSLATTGVS